MDRNGPRGPSPTFACLACTEHFRFPHHATGTWLPWNCPACRARHDLYLDTEASLGGIKLKDKVFLPTELVLPGEIHSSLAEATLAVNAGAHRAGCVMLRRAIEQLCAELGGTGSLVEKLKHVSTDRRVRPTIIAGLDALRLLGNDAAHLEGRYYDEITEEDALEAHALVMRLMTELAPSL